MSREATTTRTVTFNKVTVENFTDKKVDTITLPGYGKIPKDGRAHEVNHDVMQAIDITGSAPGVYRPNKDAKFTNTLVKFTGPDDSGRIVCSGGGDTVLFQP